MEYNAEELTYIENILLESKTLEIDLIDVIKKTNARYPLTILFDLCDKSKINTIINPNAPTKREKKICIS